MLLYKHIFSLTIFKRFGHIFSLMQYKDTRQNEEYMIFWILQYKTTLQQMANDVFKINENSNYFIHLYK